MYYLLFINNVLIELLFKGTDGAFEDAHKHYINELKIIRMALEVAKKENETIRKQLVLTSTSLKRTEEYVS